MAVVQISCAYPCGNGCAWKCPHNPASLAPPENAAVCGRRGLPRYAEVLAAGTLELPEERESLR